MLDKPITNDVVISNRLPKDQEGKNGSVWIVTDLPNEALEGIGKISVTSDQIAAKELKEEK